MTPPIRTADDPTAREVVVAAVDGDNVFHRAYHAFAPEGAAGPSPMWAPAGAVELLAKIVARVRPNIVVVGFDDLAESWRAARFDGYKATRPVRDPDVANQRLATMQLLDALGVAVRCLPGAEADDVVASAAASAAARGFSTVVVSSDRDCAAAVSDTTKLLNIAAGVPDAPLWGPAELAAEMGAPAHRYRLLAALRGDPADNLDGVPGFGKVIAARVASAMCADELLANPAAAAELVGDRLAAVLCDHLEVVARNLEVMRLVDDLDVDLPAANSLNVDVAAAARFAATDAARRLATAVTTAKVPVQVVVPRRRRKPKARRGVHVESQTR
jgi:DNA polymerase-1